MSFVSARNKWEYVSEIFLFNLPFRPHSFLKIKILSFYTSRILSLYLIGLNSIVDSNLLNWSSGDGDCSVFASIFIPQTSVLSSCQLFIPKKVLFLAINAFVSLADTFWTQKLFHLRRIAYMIFSVSS